MEPETEYFGRAGKIVAAAEARGAADERERLRKKVEEMRRNAMSRTREVAFSEVLALLAERRP